MFKTQLNTQICHRSAQNYSVKVMEFTVSNIRSLTNVKLMVKLLHFLGSVVANVSTSLCDPCSELLLCRRQQKELTLSITNPQKQSSKTCVCIFSFTGTAVVHKGLYQPKTYNSLGGLLTNLHKLSFHCHSWLLYKLIPKTPFLALTYFFNNNWKWVYTRWQCATVQYNTIQYSTIQLNNTLVQ
jgi:hypothetical protein